MHRHFEGARLAALLIFFAGLLLAVVDLASDTFNVDPLLWTVLLFGGLFALVLS